MTQQQRNLIVCVAVVLAALWLMQPRPPERPVLTALARVARVLLWGAAFLEPLPPAHREHRQPASGDYAHVDHGEGW